MTPVWILTMAIVAGDLLLTRMAPDLSYVPVCKPHSHMAYILERRLRDAVYGRTGLRVFDAFGEQPVAAANGKVLDRPLRGRVIDTQMSVFQIGFEVFFLI